MSPRSSSTAFGPEEPVGGDELDVRVVGPAGEQRLEHARRRALADRDAAPEADDERRRAGGAGRGTCRWSAAATWVAATRRFRRRDSGRYTSLTSLRSSLSFSPRSASSSCGLERQRRRRAQPRPLVTVEGAVARSTPRRVTARSRYAWRRASPQPPRALRTLASTMADTPPSADYAPTALRSTGARVPRLRRDPGRRPVRRADRLRLRRPPVRGRLRGPRRRCRPARRGDRRGRRGRRRGPRPPRHGRVEHPPAGRATDARPRRGTGGGGRPRRGGRRPGGPPRPPGARAARPRASGRSPSRLSWHATAATFWSSTASMSTHASASSVPDRSTSSTWWAGPASGT